MNEEEGLDTTQEPSISINKRIDELNKNIREILKNETVYKIVRAKSLKSGSPDFYFVTDLPATDQNIEMGVPSNFLWFFEIKKLPLFADKKYFWLGDEGLIDWRDETQDYNLYLDDDGFLIARVKDKYEVYSKSWNYRIDCHYNDINYLELYKELYKSIRDSIIKKDETINISPYIYKNCMENLYCENCSSKICGS